MARTIQFDDFVPQQHPNCAACEELITDALDGVLSASDQAFFDQHTAVCAQCMARLEEAQRGAAWLDLLKTHRPEPAAGLIERIIAQTSGQNSAPLSNDAVSGRAFSPLIAPSLPTNVLAFPGRRVSRFTQFTRVAMEPRFAMTAAMAFFSIALTLNLTGVRLDQLHASDLRPSNLKRTYYEANASAVRYYDNLRVVHVLESRVEDIRRSQADDRFTQPVPASKPKPQSEERKKPDLPAGSSRREEVLPGKVLPHSDLAAGIDRVRLNLAPDASTVSSRTKTEGGLA